MKNSHEWGRKRFPLQYSEQWSSRERQGVRWAMINSQTREAAEVRQELGGQSWSEHAVRELTGVGDPVTQHGAGRVQNQIVQMPEAPSYGWSIGWLNIQPPAHAHRIDLGLRFPRKPIHAHGFWLCLWSCYQIVTAVLWMLLCQCLLTSAKKHPSVWGQQGAFKFNDDNEHTKEVITTRRAWFFTYLQKKDLEQWKEWKRCQVIESCTWQEGKKKLHGELCQKEEVVDQVILSWRTWISCETSQVQKRNHRRLTTDT